jgi:hypothetical protein
MDIEGIGPLSERIDGSLGRIQARITSWRQTGAIRRFRVCGGIFY